MERGYHSQRDGSACVVVGGFLKPPNVLLLFVGLDDRLLRHL